MFSGMNVLPPFDNHSAYLLYRIYRQCSEKCVMNNYFGIGLDAKISLEFNNKRDEHPKKCRYE